MTRKRHITKPQSLGFFTMHDSTIEIYADPTSYGSAVEYRWDDPKTRLKMYCSIKHDNKTQVLNGMLHEVLETSFVLMRLSFEPFERLRVLDTARFRFMMDHTQFAVAVQHAADTIRYLEPRLLRVWGELHDTDPIENGV